MPIRRGRQDMHGALIICANWTITHKKQYGRRKLDLSPQQADCTFRVGANQTVHHEYFKRSYSVSTTP